MSEERAGLVRAIGRWTLAALVLNSLIGSGIFGLPKEIARLLGPAAPFAYLLGAAGAAIIMACFAEVASQFREAGGPYLYARQAFGRLAGIQIGWLAWLVRLTSAAANASLLVVYLGEFLPWSTEPMPRAAILTLLILLLAAVNLRGVSGGARLANAFTAAKLLPLVAFIAVGLFFVQGGTPAEASSLGASQWALAILAMMFAYGGFESALVPMSEAKDPRRDAPVALFVAIASCAAIYTLIHVVVMSTLDDPSTSDRPLADAARVMLGDAGATFITVGALISMYGYLSGQMVSAPRLTYAFAERRDFPGVFAAVHPRFRTPHLSIAIYALLVWALALYGSFFWNAILSAVARLFTYAFVCAALLVFRRRKPNAGAFRLPVGWLFAGLGMLFCIVLITQMGLDHLQILAVVIAMALANYLWSRRQVDPAPGSS